MITAKQMNNRDTVQYPNGVAISFPENCQVALISDKVYLGCGEILTKDSIQSISMHAMAGTHLIEIGFKDEEEELQFFVLESIRLDVTLWMLFDLAEAVGNEMMKLKEFSLHGCLFLRKPETDEED